mmetsp:Transcript_13603/g.42946  ORF Transcript_13603/g.42946 Transcript_13603/m.42946 type:complete len:230 (-) Transcript_13603:36-725(-)
MRTSCFVHEVGSQSAAQVRRLQDADGGNKPVNSGAVFSSRIWVARAHALLHRDEVRVARLGEGPGDRIVEDVDHLFRVIAHGMGTGVDLLEGVAERRRVERDEALPEGRRVAGVEGCVPLAILFAEAHDDHVSLGDERLRAYQIESSSLVVVVWPLRLVAENYRPAVVRVLVTHIRRRQDHRKLLRSDPRRDLLAPRAVDFAREVHLPRAPRRHASPPRRRAGPSEPSE